MTRDDSRAQRFAKIWLGPSLATLVGIGSTVELAAMPIPAARLEFHGPTLIQQSPGSPREGQQPAGTARPPSADESKPDSFTELHEALTAARERLGDLSRAAKAVAATGQLQQELAALREENQQMRAAIEAARAERGDLQTATLAAQARAAQLSEMRDSLQRAEQEKARIGADLAKVQGELASTKQQVAAAGQEQAQLDQRV